MKNIDSKKLTITMLAVYIVTTSMMAFVIYNQKLEIDNINHYLQHVALEKALQHQ